MGEFCLQDTWSGDLGPCGSVDPHQECVLCMEMGIWGGCGLVVESTGWSITEAGKRNQNKLTQTPKSPQAPSKQPKDLELFIAEKTRFGQELSCYVRPFRNI